MKKILLSVVLSFSVLGNMVSTNAIAATVRAPLTFGVRASGALESISAKMVRKDVLERIQRKGFLTDPDIKKFVDLDTTESWVEVLGMAAGDAGLKAAEPVLWKDFLTGGVPVDATRGSFTNQPPHELSFIVFSALR